MRKINAVIVDTFEYKLLSRQAIYRVLKLPNINKVYVFSELPIVEDNRVVSIRISKINNNAEYNNFIINRLHEFVHLFEESHFLIFQWDGFPLSSEKWDDSFLDHDYIGAPWFYTESDTGVVGNSGFCLVSTKLFKTLHALEIKHDITNHSNDDQIICIQNRRKLEENGIVFAPVEVAMTFSRESRFNGKSFGFHGAFNLPLVFSEREILNFWEDLSTRMQNNQTTFLEFLSKCMFKDYRRVIGKMMKNKDKDPFITKVLYSERFQNYCSENGIDSSRFA